MTKSERTQLRRAISLLGQDSGYDEAVEILFRLAGMPRGRIGDGKVVTMEELMGRVRPAGGTNTADSITRPGLD